jgi:hypothetical protein
LTPSARSGDLIAGDGTKNGLSRSEQKTVRPTQNNRLTEKAPYKSSANPFRRRLPDYPDEVLRRFDFIIGSIQASSD